MTRDILRGISDKHVRQLLTKARKQGCTFVRSGGDHIRVLGPDDKLITSTGMTASDHRSWLNVRAELRKAGVDV